MKAFITGITGFVGSHLAEYLLDKNVEIYGLTRWRSDQGNIKHLRNRIKLLYGDLLDYASLISALNESDPDFIFHLAAQSYVPYSFKAPVATMEVNCLGTCNLLEAVKYLKTNKRFDPIFHTCSSSECYGQVNTNEIPINESVPLRPASPYAVSKVCEDLLSYQYWLSWGIKTIRTRLFSHSGARRHEVFVESNFAKQLIEIEKGIKEPIVDVGNLNSIRTYMDIKDAVRAYWLLVNKCSPGEVYNIGGNITMSVGDMLNMLIKCSGLKNIKIRIDKERMRPSDVTLQIPDFSKFTSATGWVPEIPFEQTLMDLLDYWRNSITTSTTHK